MEVYNDCRSRLNHLVVLKINQVPSLACLFELKTIIIFLKCYLETILREIGLGKTDKNIKTASIEFRNINLAIGA